MLGPVMGGSGALGEGGGWFDADGRLAEARPCLRCGYDLRGLSAVEACPECGRAVRASLVGPTLARADARWVGGLVLGTRAALAGVWAVLAWVGALVTVMVVTSLADMDYLPAAWVGWLESRRVWAAMGWALWAALGLTVAGWWLLGARDPSLGRGDPQSAASRRARLASLAMGAALVVLAGPWAGRVLRSLQRLGPDIPTAVAAGATVVAILGWGLVAVRSLRWLPLRVPDMVLQRKVRRAVSASGLAVVMALGVSVGALVVELAWPTGNTPTWVRGLIPIAGLVALLAMAAAGAWFVAYALALVRLGRTLRRVRSARGAERGMP